MKKIILIISIFYLAIFTGNSTDLNKYSSKLDAYSMMKLMPLLEADTKSQIDRLAASNQLQYPYKIIGENLLVDMLVQVSSTDDIEKLKLLDCNISTIINDIAAVSVPAVKLKELVSQDWLKRAEAGKLYSLNLDKSRIDIQADKVHQGIQLDMPYMGEGVIVGVFDSGIDFTHPDFSDENGTRILYLWDMTDRAEKKPPTEYGYDWGYVYTKSDIDNNPVQVLQRDPDANSGHGTHVTGTAAGGGKADPDMTGIAPKSDIIFVKGTRTDDEKLFSENDIIAGCDFIFRKASELGKPAVINLSLGTPLGPHDGSSLQEQALNALINKGKIIVASAGNSGELPIHAGTEASAGVSFVTIIFPFNICTVYPEFCGNIPNIFKTAADIWFNEGIVDSIGIGILNQAFQPLYERTFSFGENFENQPLMYNGNNIGYISIYSATSSETGSGNITWFLSNEGDTSIKISNYFWTIRTIGNKNGRIDMWAAVPINGDNEMSIGAPASGKNIISVGSYVTKNEWNDIDGNSQSGDGTIDDISAFSSRGPTRDGRMAPIISAPGQMIFAPLSSHLTEGIGYSRSDVLQGGKYRGMQGTSMSSPHVTGVIALMLQVNKNLAPDDIKKIFEVSARRDGFTGNEPNNTWGYGKLDAHSAMKSIITSVAENSNDNQLIIYPNPADNFIVLAVGKQASAVNPIKAANAGITFEVYNSLGLKIKNVTSNSNQALNIDLSDCPSGAYFIRYSNYDKNITAPFIISK